VDGRPAGGREIVAVLRERRRLAPGDRLRLSPKPGMVHLYDAGSGERI
jgi:multiple sugar transport system ATP-binding protein